MAKKRFLSGIQPSGQLHVGNYFGAVKQFVDLQDEYEGFISIVNYHALTSAYNRFYDPEILKTYTINLVKDLLASGIDPKKSVLFLQSDIPEVTELAWIFSTVVPISLVYTPALKEKLSRDTEGYPNVGLLTYPILQAADILIVDADVVPVGDDQRAHIEISRDISRKFSVSYGETFKVPKEMILKEVAVVPGVDGQKMSKSYNNVIPLFGSDDEIRSQVAKIVTDSSGVKEPKDPENDNVFALHKLFSKEELPEIEKKYKEGGMGHKESKDLLAENIIKTIKPMREKRESISDEEVLEVLKKGAEKVRPIAESKLKIVREKVGLI